MVVAADHQAAVGQQGQDVAIGRDTRMAQDQNPIGARQGGRKLGPGPVRRGWNVQLVARNLGIGVQGVGPYAHDAQGPGAEGQGGRRGGVAFARAPVAYGADDLDAQGPQTRHDLSQVRGQVVVVIAQVEHGGRQARQGLDEGPVDHTAGPHGHGVAVFEQVAVDGDHMGNRMGPHLPFKGGQQLGGAFIGRMHVRNRQHPADRLGLILRSQADQARRQRRRPGQLQKTAAGRPDERHAQSRIWGRGAQRRDAPLHRRTSTLFEQDWGAARRPA